MRTASCWLMVLMVGLLSAERSDTWLHCTILDSEGKYSVCWRLYGDGLYSEIEFMVEVQAHGYVGFGLSPNGGMAGSDIVTGWIKDGTTYFQDRHGRGNILPEIDAHEDWKLISATENDTHTSFTFRRKSDTCDKDDIRIDDSTMRLIYAYSDEDPVTVNDLQYHFRRRGVKSALLLQKARKGAHKTDKTALSRWDVLSPNFVLRSNFTTMYWCKIYKAPQVAEKNHIILVEPFIEAGHESFVHHVLLYECVGSTAEEYDPHVHQGGHRCHMPNMPDAMKKCEGVTLAWGVGGEDLVLPEHVGIPLESGPSKYYMMEIHYDNPSRREGIVDRSGFRIYYTPKLRKYDAGTLMLGSTVSLRLIVPPQQAEYVVAGHSNPACLDPVMPQDGIKVLGAFLHAHLLGRRLRARHFRKGKELPPLAEDNNYDFNYQEYRYYSKEVDFLQGDQVTVECIYDSSERNVTTFGGESTRQEMCLVFLLYYPLIKRFASVSVPKPEVVYEAIGTNFSKSGIYKYYEDTLNLDWTKLNIGEVQTYLLYGLHDTHCYHGDGEKNSIKEPISYPETLRPYKKISSCIQSNFQWTGKNCGPKKYLEIYLSFFVLAALYTW